MKYTSIFLAGTVIGLLLIGAACSNTTSGKNGQNQTSSESSGTDATDGGDLLGNDTTVEEKSEIIRSGDSIKVTNLRPNQELPESFTVEGTTAAEQVYVRVKNDSGDEFVNTTVNVHGGLFKVNLQVLVNSSTSGTVEVFSKNQSGDESNLVLIPVKFKTQSSGGTSVRTNVSVRANSETVITE